jgi:hypothetical protein
MALKINGKKQDGRQKYPKMAAAKCIFEHISHTNMN